MFADQRVLVTGSGRGIGKAIARRFAQGGARIQLVARSREELETTRAELLELTQEVRATALDSLFLTRLATSSPKSAPPGAVSTFW